MVVDLDRDVFPAFGVCLRPRVAGDLVEQALAGLVAFQLAQAEQGGDEADPIGDGVDAIGDRPAVLSGLHLERRAEGSMTRYFGVGPTRLLAGSLTVRSQSRSLREYSASVSCLYRFKTRRMVPDLGFQEGSVRQPDSTR